MIEAWRTSDEREELGGGDGVKVTSPTATLSHFLVTSPSPALVAAARSAASYCSTNCGTVSPATAFSAAFFFFLAVLGFAEVLRSF